MPQLVAELKKEHIALKEKVAAIKQAGVVTEAGFKGLLELNKMLQGHIAHEDARMYPRLQLAAATDENLATLLKRFQNEMQEIVNGADQFYQQYKRPEQTLDYARDVARLFSTLTNRIVTEESVLYPYLDQIDL